MKRRDGVTRHRTRGFTLLELNIALFIVSILVLIALPLYLDFQTRARVAEGLGQIGPFKNALAIYYLSDGTWPTSNAEAGLSPPESYSSEFIARVEVAGGGSGHVTITFTAEAVPSSGGPATIVFAPQASGGGFTWDCTGGTLADKYRPGNCR